MSMEITNNYSDYGKGYTNTAKEGNVTIWRHCWTAPLMRYPMRREH